MIQELKLTKLQLQDLLHAYEHNPDEAKSYLNIETGEIVTFFEYYGDRN